MLELKKVFSVSRSIGMGLLLFPMLSHAVGLGKLTVNSQLGEPLDMVVTLNSVTPAELGTLSVGLASRSDFARAGVSYPDNAALVKFQVGEDDDGGYIVTITSDNAINETFLHFLLSVSWSGGKVVREYTALLDPPLYSGASGTTVVVPDTPNVTTLESVESAESTETVESAQQVEPVEEIAATETAVEEPALSTESSTVTVAEGDTLSAILIRMNRPESITLVQGLMAIVRENPQAFVNGNMNRLLAGAELNVPSFSEMQDVDVAAARETFNKHLDDFNAYRNALVAAPADEAEPVAAVEPVPEPILEPELIAEPEPAGEDAVEAEQVAEEPQPAVEEEAVVEAEPEPVSEPAQEVAETPATDDSAAEEDTRLSISQETDAETLESAASGDSGEPVQVEALQTQLAQMDEELLTSGQENTELRQQIEEMQAQVDRLSRLLEVEDTSLALAQNEAARDEAEDTVSAAAPAISTAADGIVADEAGDSAVSGEQDEETALMLASQDVQDPQTGSGPDDGSGQDGDGSSPTAAGADSDVATGDDEAASSGADTAVTAAATDSEAQVAESGQADAAQDTAATTTDTSVAGSSEPVTDEATDTAAQEVVAGEEAAEASAGAAEEEATTRQVADNSIMDAVSGTFSSLGSMLTSVSDYALKIAAALIALLGGLFFYRRYRSKKEFEESMVDIESEQVSTNSELGSLQQMSAASGIDLASQNSDLELTVGGGMSFLSEDGVSGVAEEDNEVIHAGVVDPLAEADVYLAYDRDEQAVQVLKEAYEQHPERIELAEKLLEIYHKQDDRRAFDTLAADLKPSYQAGAVEWDRIAGMGREVSPDNKLYQTELTAGLDAGAESDIIQVGEMSGSLSSADQFSVNMDVEEPAPTGRKEEAVDEVLAAAATKADDAADEPASVKAGFGPDDDAGIDTPTLSQIIQGPLEDRVDFDLQRKEEPVKAEEPPEIPEEVTDEEVEEAADALDEDSLMSEMSEQSLGQIEPYHESETALELAKAYIELGEKDIAKGFIEEVISEGSEKQREKAEKLVKNLAE